jgi:hypothetical protein
MSMNKTWAISSWISFSISMGILSGALRLTTPFLPSHFSLGNKIENCSSQFLAVCWIVHVEFKVHRLRDGFTLWSDFDDCHDEAVCVLLATSLPASRSRHGSRQRLRDSERSSGLVR